MLACDCTTAIDDNSLTDDVACFFRGQKDGQARDVHRFADQTGWNGVGGLFQVEQLSILTTLNSGTVTQPGSPVTEVSDGFCGF